MILRTTAFLLTSAALQAVPLTKLPDGPYLFPATVADTPHAVGNYAGSIYGYGEDGLPGRVARGGFDSFRLGKGGSYSGRGRIDGAVFSLKGKFSPEDGQSTAQVALKGTSAVALSLVLAKGDDGSVRITGVLTGLAGSLPLAIDLAASNHGDEAVRSVGRYTAYFPAFGADAVLPQPMGAGVATMTVDGKGVLRCQYILPDGTQGTRSGALAGLGVWQFYFPAGGSAAAQGGLLAGHVNFWRIAHGPDFWNDLEGVISWKMPANPRPGATPFPAGFDVQRKVSGKRYVPEYKGDPAWYELESGVANAYLTTGPGSVTPAAEVSGSAESGGGVKQVAAIGGSGPPRSGPATGDGVLTDAYGGTYRPLDWTVKDAITGTDASLKLNRKTGLITGTVTDPATRVKTRLFAVVIPDGYGELDGFFLRGKAAAGYLFITPAPK